MFNHERFRKLTALGSLGELSAEENRDLEQHLNECPDCRRLQEDYSKIMFHELPKADVKGRGEGAVFRPTPDQHRRDRFLARARAEGIELSGEADRPSVSPLSTSNWAFRWRTSLAVAALALITLTGIMAGRRYRLVPRSPVLRSPSVRRMSETEGLKAHGAILPQSREQQSAELIEMRPKSSVSDASLHKIQRELESAQARMAELSAELSHSMSDNADYARSEEQKDGTIADLRVQNELLNRQRADNLGDAAMQAARIRQLTQSLEEERADLERERQLMAASNDVRQLMGARNLHIIDVLDVNGGGRSAKAFGRVFYAEGQSLIFYAFDLPSSGLSPAKYTFQAWGQAEARPVPSRKLGVFEVDSHDQHRWVLKINDSSLLAGIDSVFVTAESLGEAKEPRGRKLLYAYIGGQPNHP